MFLNAIQCAKAILDFTTSMKSDSELTVLFLTGLLTVLAGLYTNLAGPDCLPSYRRK